MTAELSKTSRVGREHQRYSEAGERLVAGVVALSDDNSQVLIIQSVRRGAWVLPKGGWETDEATAEAAALREAWEEAGIVCTVVRDLGQITDNRATEQLTKKAPRALFQFFEAHVTKEESEWPEKHKRDRKWADYAEAKDKLQERPELLEALERSSIQRS